MNSKDVLTRLEHSDAWIKTIAVSHCPFIKKMKTPPKASFFRELTVRIDTGQLDRFGKPKPQRRRFDLVALVKPHYKAWGRDNFSVGIEIKVTKSDLLNDEKWQDYLNYCDYFFFCVPEALVHHALKIADGLDCAGVISAERCVIEKMPLFNDMTDDCAAELYKECAFRV